MFTPPTLTLFQLLRFLSRTETSSSFSLLRSCFVTGSGGCFVSPFLARLRGFVLLYILLLVLGGVSPVHAQSFPSGSGLVVDVTDHGVVGDGVTDVTAPLQALIDTYKGNAQTDYPRILYFPDGTYLLSDSITGTLLDDGSGFGWIILQGESESGTVLKLADNAVGFDDPANPKPLLLYFGGNWSNNVFGNALESLTVDVGSGNPGATAVAFFCNNFGWVRDVTLRASGANPQGSIGLDLGYRGPNGIGLIDSLTVEGFRIGVSNVGHSQMMPWIFEDLRLIGQSEVGLLHDVKPLSIRRLYSDNSVPAIRMTEAGGMMSILDSEFVGGAAGTPAILVEEALDFNEMRMRSGHVLIRNVKHSGYAAALQVGGQLVPGDFSRSSYRTQKDSAGLWANRPDEFLAMEVPEIPEVSAGDPANWEIVDPAGRNDHTELLREAFFSGAETIVLKPGAYTISGTIRIGPDVRKVMGQMALINLDTAFAIQEKPIFLVEESRHPAVQVEKLYANWGGQGTNTTRAWAFHNASTADLLLQDIFWPMGPFFRNDPLARGQVFLRNIHSLPGGQNNPRTDISPFIFDYQRVWAWQLNPEMHMPHVTNRGSDLWLFGFKFGEREGPFLKASYHGRTEILTGGMNTTDDHQPPDAANATLLEVEDATVTGMFLERASYQPSSGANGWGFHPVVLRETRNGVERQITHTADGSDISSFTNHQFSDPNVVRRPSHLSFLDTFGAFFGFLATGFDPDTANAEPEVSVNFPSAHSFGTALSLDGTMSDPDGGPGPLLGFWSKVDGPGRVLFDDPESLATQANFSQPGDYTLRWTARDGVGETFAEQTVSVVWDQTETLYPANDATATDNDEDGLGDNWGGPGNGIYGQVATFRRFIVNFDIRHLIGHEDSIASANLRLTVEANNGGSGSVEVYHNTDGYGVMNSADYETPSTLVSTFGGPFSEGSIKDVDITAALQSALAAGKPYLEIRLQRLDEASQWDWIGFYGRTATDTADRPQITIETIPAAAPASVLVEQRGPDALELEWTPGSSNDAGYRIERSADGGAFTEVAVVPPDQLSYTDETVLGGVSYQYRVSAENAGGLSSPTLSTSISLGVDAPVASEVAVTGRVAVGNSVTGSYLYANEGGQSEAGSTYRWLVADQADGLYQPVPDATTLTFSPTAVLRGRYLVFEVTPASAGASGLAVRSVPQQVSGALVPPQAVLPEIAGVALEGNTLYGQYEYYDDNGDPAAASLYRWLISDDPASGYAPIAGASSTSLTLEAAHVGKYLLFEVTPVSHASPQQGVAATSAPIYVPAGGQAAVSINFYDGGTDFQLDSSLSQGPASFGEWNNFTPRTNVTTDYKSFHSSTGLLDAGGMEIRVIADRLVDVSEQGTPSTPEEELGYGYLFYNANGEALRLENIGEAFDLSQGYSLYLLTGVTAGSDRDYTYTLHTGDSASTTGNSTSFGSWVEGTNYVRFDNLQENDLTIEVASSSFNKNGIAGLQIVGVPVQGPAVSSVGPSATEATAGGGAQVGGLLTGQYQYSDPAGELEGGSSYRWLVGSSSSGSFVPVPGATGLSFTPQAEHADRFLVFEVTPRNAQGNEGNTVSSSPVLVLSASDAQAVAVGVNFTAGGSTHLFPADQFAGPAQEPRFANWNHLSNPTPDASVNSLNNSDGNLQSGLTLSTQGALRNRDNGTPGTPLEQMGLSYLEWGSAQNDALSLSGLGDLFDLSQGYTVFLILGTHSGGDRTLEVTCVNTGATHSATGNITSFASWQEGVNYLKFEGLQDDSLSFHLASPFFNKVGIAGIQIVGQRLPELSGFAAWQHANFADPNAALANDAADPDGDRLQNLVEYALGGDPLVVDTHLLPTVATSNQHLTLDYTPAATEGLRFLIESSADLTSWSEEADVTSLLSPGQPYTFIDTAVEIGPSHVRRFLRLRIEVLP